MVTSRFSGHLAVALLIALSAGAAPTRGDEPKPGLKKEHFDRDPGWEAFNNRIVPAKIPTVVQDFGYSAPAPAGDAVKGAMGGRITRASKAAYYADDIPPRTLNDKLTASGTFALTASSSGSGVFFGWFNAQQPGASGRPLNSLGLHIDGERSGGRLAVRMINSANQSTGTFITRFEPYRTLEEKAEKRPTPIRNDGTRYTWTLAYDPDAAAGNGQFRFTIKSNSATPHDFEGKAFSVDLPAGFKQVGATFDRFGLMNGTKPGGAMTIHFDDLGYDQQAEDFAKDPGWIESGNRETYQDPIRVGAHDFGFSPDTHLAGGSAGEVGGSFWRGGVYGYYADPVGPFSFEDRLEARGKVVLAVGAPDADMFLGWFDSAAREHSPAVAGSFIGVHVGGPTRVGHYFHPAFATATGTHGVAQKGPVLLPGKPYEWSLLYDPTANGGKGAIEVKLGEESITLPLKDRIKSQGGRFDRFGLFTHTIGGQLVKLYVDDLTYTAAPAKP